jgi:hypothetical protein
VAISPARSLVLAGGTLQYEQRANSGLSAAGRSLVRFGHLLSLHVARAVRTIAEVRAELLQQVMPAKSQSTRASSGASNAVS